MRRRLLKFQNLRMGVLSGCLVFLRIFDDGPPSPLRHLHQKLLPPPPQPHPPNLKMIYGLKALIALLVVYTAFASVKFRLEKKSDREFVSGILARAQKGLG